MLQCCLSEEGFAVSIANSAESAIEGIQKKIPDLILLDWMLPGASGYKLLKHLRHHKPTQHIPIVMLTARDEEENKVSALQEGADDYVTKPFSTRELCARITSVLRRTKPHAIPKDIAWGQIVLKPQERQVFIQGAEVSMPSGEFNLLHFFMLHPERTYSRTQILNSVWGANKFVEERTVDVQIGRLRKILKSYRLDLMIETVRGFGYRLRPTEEASKPQ